MKKNLLFKIVVDVIVVAGVIGMVKNFHAGAIFGGLIAFGCGIWMATDLAGERVKRGFNNKNADARFEVIGTGVLMGLTFALAVGFMFGNGLVCLFAFCGAILGAVVGLFHKK